MIVVSDMSPLNYLLLIEAINLLPEMYGAILIPEAVRRELLAPSAPLQVRLWAAQLPEWVSVRSPRVVLALSLDAGEQEAISLALEVQAEIILIDERKGRRIAEEHGLQATGILGLLEEAALRGLIGLADALTRLQAAGFYAAPQLIADLLKNNANE